MRILRNILLIASLSVTSLLAAIVIISLVYEDKIAHYAIEEINKYIRTPIEVRKISFTLLRKFPDATIRFRDIYIKSVPDFEQVQFSDINTDTLLYAKDISIQMNLIKLLKNQYIVKEVNINDGILNLFNDQNGSGNYKFWKTGKAVDSPSFRIELQHVKVAEVYLQNYNLAKKINLRAKIDKLTLQGDLTAKEYQLNFSFDGDIINYISNGFDYLSDKKVLVKSNIHVIEKNFQILSSDLLIERLRFNIEGIAKWDKKIMMDMVISGNDLNIETLIKHLPLKKMATDLSRYRASGILNFEAHISGLYSNKEMPEVEADFSLNNGSIYNHRLGRNYEKIELTGQFTNGTEHHARTSEINIWDVNVESRNSRLGGALKIKDLVQPDINYQIKANLDLEDILPYFNTEKLEYYNGSLMIQMDIKGSQDSLFRIKKENLLNWQYSGVVIPENIQFKMVDNPLIFEEINGSLIFKNYLYLNDLSLIISGNDLNISGRLDNFIDYVLTDKGNLWMDINLYSPELILDTLIIKDHDSDKNNDDNIFPERIYLKSRFWIDHFLYKNFEADNMRGDIVYKPGWLWFNSLDFSAMGGTLHGDGFIEQEDHKNYMIRINSNVEQLDITKLFQSFNNFGQEYIQDKHLKGKLSGEVDFYSGFDQHSRIRKETILAESNVEILDGELIHFEPMLGLSNFIEVEELEHIKFSTLKNRIFIRQSEVIIPQMDIFSSAINISGSGTHGFSNFFIYKVSLDLSDLLLKKPRKNELEFEEHIIQDDGLGRTRIFLTIEGTPDNYKINYDRRGAMRSLKDKLDNEKVELKTILREEFGIFRSDTLPEGQKDTNQLDFIIEWEDTDFTEADTINKNKPGKQKFRIEWEDEENNTGNQQQKK